MAAACGTRFQCRTVADAAMQEAGLLAAQACSAAYGPQCMFGSSPHRNCPSLHPLCVRQVSNLLARATNRSLVLLDEFGKGTLSADGVGLLASLLQHYAAQPSPPLLLACTHFSELLDPGK